MDYFGYIMFGLVTAKQWASVPLPDITISRRVLDKKKKGARLLLFNLMKSLILIVMQT